MIKQRMDKIDHHLHELYKTWHAEYGNANTLEECARKSRTFINPIWINMSPNIECCINYYNNQG